MGFGGEGGALNAGDRKVLYRMNLPVHTAGTLLNQVALWVAAVFFTASMITWSAAKFERIHIAYHF